MSHPTPRSGLLPAGRPLSGPGLVGGSTPGPTEPDGRLRLRPPPMHPLPSHTTWKSRPRLQTQAPLHPAQLGHAPASLGSLLRSMKHLWAHLPRRPARSFLCSRPASLSPTMWPTGSGGLPGRDGPADPKRPPLSRGCTTEASPGGHIAAPHPEHSHQGTSSRASLWRGSASRPHAVGSGQHSGPLGT